ncbi:MAG: PIN domain-containing protein [Planctomycetaceae bacterium]
MFLDASGLLCILDRREPSHVEAVTYLSASPHGMTHTAVIFELVALAESRGLLRQVVLDFIAGLHANPAVDVFQLNEQDDWDALDLLQSRTDKSWSLCDAVSFNLMQDRGLALTTDHHFEQAGFVRLLTSLTT